MFTSASWCKLNEMRDGHSFVFLYSSSITPVRAVVTWVNIGGKRQHSILPLVRVVRVCANFCTSPKWCILQSGAYCVSAAVSRRVIGYPPVVKLSGAKFRRGAVLISRLIFINYPISVNRGVWLGTGPPCGQCFRLLLRTTPSYPSGWVMGKLVHTSC